MLNYAFYKRILPRTAWRSEHLFNTQAFDTPLTLASINSVAIPQKALRCCIPRIRFDDLLPGPVSGGMLRDIEVQHPTTVMRKDHQDEQHFESHRRHHKEIDRHQVFDMIVQKRFPHQ
jgi:hypothetical protein